MPVAVMMVGLNLLVLWYRLCLPGACVPCGGVLLRTDDLEKALREYGVPLHKPPYYADSYVPRRLFFGSPATFSTPDPKVAVRRDSATSCALLYLLVAEALGD